MVLPHNETEPLEGEDKIQERLNAVTARGCNRTCIDCNVLYPTWASILTPVTEGGQRIAVLCCFQCYGHHVQLGKDVCEVKSMKLAADWTDADMKVLEETGNGAGNCVYEASIKVMDDTEKEKILRLKEEDMKGFIQEKYQQRKFFSERMYHHIFDRRSRQRMRAKGLKSKSPCPDGIHRLTPSRTISLFEDAGDRRHGLRKSHSDRHAGGFGKMRSDVGTGDIHRSHYRGKSSQRNSGEISKGSNHGRGEIPKGSSHSQGRRTRSPKMSGMERRTDGIKRSRSAGYFDKQSGRGAEELSLRNAAFDRSGHRDKAKSTSHAEGDGIPSSSGHGEQRNRKKGERTKAVPSIEVQPATDASSENTGRDHNQSDMPSLPGVGMPKEIPSSSGHSEKRQRRKVERSASKVGTRETEGTKTVEGADGGSASKSDHSGKSTSSKENEIPSTSAHSERRTRKRESRKIERPETAKRSSSGTQRRRKPPGHPGETRPVEALKQTNSGSQRRKKTPGHSGETRPGEAPKRTNSGRQPRRRPIEQPDGLALGDQPQGSKELPERSASTGEGQKPNNRPGMARKSSSCRNLMLGSSADTPRQGRRRLKRRNSLDHKNVSSEEQPTVGNEPSKLDRIASRRHGGRRLGRRGVDAGTPGTGLEDGNEGPVLVEERDSHTTDKLPSPEELGYEYEHVAAEEEEEEEEPAKEKKKSSWKKKLVKLAKGGLGDKHKGDRPSAEDSHSVLHPTAGAIPKNALTFGAKVA
ncbi:with coiled-coil, ANK repeat and PH domain-containing protein [Seminavis robusta]|uniref:With coiled-coil, ANK repeat and PH domain-containing protein n=1 Tax=Seminavis robusta TaxID=568900 RepID=A0A9N8HA82_9STRA|nr:with coiled-coil, ANK repeat and PH domain-containing protein [Seminavis robusta]|eukprot:Sro139_g065180.1 with coiled-coil, ANK repeat and PH domain-containing protein (752) ;mRNA; r:86493-88938